jgi:hypothetical protein
MILQIQSPEKDDGYERKRKVLIITAIKIWLICFPPYAENKADW